MKKCLLLIFALLFLIGCSSEPTVKQTEESLEVEETNAEDNENNIPDNEDIIDGDENTDKIDNEAQNENKVKSSLTGLYIDKDKLNDRPIAVMLDNFYKARPQAGLSEADVIYEILAEGNITRYMAIICTGKPETIGPIRSSRPYFLDKALEYDPLYVHVGGSPQALNDIKVLKMADIDALSAGANVFWRKKHKPIPNNMYSSYNAIVKEAERRKYKEKGEFQTLSFNDIDTEINGEKLINIKFPYSKNYVSGFRYNEDDKLYYRFVNDKPHIDEVSDIHLSTKNIIVQYADNKVLDSKLRLEIDLIGEGKGIYITNGKMIDVTWKKSGRRDLTRFYDLEGNEIKFNPGITWYQVVPSSMNVLIN